MCHVIPNLHGRREHALDRRGVLDRLPALRLGGRGALRKRVGDRRSPRRRLRLLLVVVGVVGVVVVVVAVVAVVVVLLLVVVLVVVVVVLLLVVVVLFVSNNEVMVLAIDRIELLPFFGRCLVGVRGRLLLVVAF